MEPDVEPNVVVCLLRPSDEAASDEAGNEGAFMLMTRMHRETETLTARTATHQGLKLHVPFMYFHELINI